MTEWSKIRPGRSGPEGPGYGLRPERSADYLDTETIRRIANAPSTFPGNVLRDVVSDLLGRRVEEERKRDRLAELLARHDGMAPRREALAALYVEAESYPDTYAEADEMSADLNEELRDIADALVALLREEG